MEISKEPSGELENSLDWAQFWPGDKFIDFSRKYRHFMIFFWVCGGLFFWSIHLEATFSLEEKLPGVTFMEILGAEEARNEK